MKSVVSKVICMASVVGFALVIGQAAVAADAAAADKGKQGDKKEVTQTKVVVVHADGETTVAEALKKTLSKELKGLPKELQEKIEQKLRATLPHQPLKLQAAPHKQHAAHEKHAASHKKTVSVRPADKKPNKQMKVVVVRATADKAPTDKATAKGAVEVETEIYVVGDDGNMKKVSPTDPRVITKHIDLKVSKNRVKKAQVKAEAKKAVAIRVIAAKEGAAKKHAVKAKKLMAAKVQHAAEAHKKAYTIAIKVTDGANSAKDMSKEITVKVENGKVFVNGKPVADLGDIVKKGIHAKIEKAHKADAKPTAHGKMIFMDDDGNVQEFEFDGTMGGVGGMFGAAKAHKGMPHAIMMRKHFERIAGQHAKPGIQIRALQLGADAHPHATHAMRIGHMQADKTHAEATKRLKGIESELKKIRKLLEKMQGDEDDNDHDADHGHHGDHGHDHDH